jgi:hypothetical protein
MTDSGKTETYLRLYTGDDGDSHFENVEVEMTAVDFAPSTPPLDLSAFMPAKQCAFFSGPAGWIGDWHPSSERNLFIVISGEWEVEASDGEIRRVASGSVLLCEDTTGKGHRSRVINDKASLALLIQLTEA